MFVVVSTDVVICSGCSCTMGQRLCAHVTGIYISIYFEVYIYIIFYESVRGGGGVVVVATGPLRSKGLLS